MTALLNIIFLSDWLFGSLIFFILELANWLRHLMSIFEAVSRKYAALVANMDCVHSRRHISNTINTSIFICLVLLVLMLLIRSKHFGCLIVLFDGVLLAFESIYLTISWRWISSCSFKLASTSAWFSWAIDNVVVTPVASLVMDMDDFE